MKPELCLLAGGLILSGCAHVTTVSHQPTPAAARTPRPVLTAMDRQVRNAVDAGEGDAVVVELRRRLAANPDDIKSRLALAARYQEQGYPDLAVEHLRFGVARAPHLSLLSIRLAKALEASGETGQAVDVLKAFYGRDPLAPAELVSLLGIYLDRMGESAQAETNHRAALALEPANDIFHNNLGYNLLLQEKNDDAVREFRAAVALNSRSEVARNNLGTALAKSGSLQEAVLQWQSVSGPAAAHSNLASVLLEQKRYPEAKKELELALSFDRNHPAALANLALLGEQQGAASAVTLAPRPTAWQKWTHGLRRTARAGKAEIPPPVSGDAAQNIHQ